MRHLRPLALLLGVVFSTVPAGALAKPSAGTRVAAPPAQVRQAPAWVEPPVLMYHRVDTVPGKTPLARALTVTPQQLRDQLAQLRMLGLQAISVADLYERLRTHASLERAVVMTFDDGYEDQYRYAFPILMDAGARATFYIVTGNVGKKNHVTWDEIDTMVRGGMDIGAHGLAHLELPAMTDRQQTAQIDGSLAILRERLRLPIESYAYPSGRFDRRTLQIVAAAGVPLALTTDPIANQNQYDLGRLRVLGSWSPLQFREALLRALAHEEPVEGR